MRVNAKVDINHADVVAGLRKAGYSVISLAAIGKGVPDLLVSGRNVMLLMEVKSGNNWLNPLQQAWWADWRGVKPVVVHSAEEAVAIMDEAERVFEIHLQTS